MARKKFHGDTVYHALNRLPNGMPRLTALSEAIRQADEAEDHYWRLLLRYDYACQATFHDDPPKAMPVAAEFAAIFADHSDVLFERSSDGAAEMYLMITQMGLDPIVSLPQIPKAQWEALMDQFYGLVKEYHTGLRTYWWQMCQFWQYIDRDQAFVYFQKFWRTGRDGLSDCRACERSNAVRMCLLVGDREAADTYAKPMEAGHIRFCNDTPQRYWLAYLEDALDRRELDRAAVLASKLYRKADRDRNDLSYTGALIRCWAYTEPARAQALIQKRFGWTIGLWDQKKCYDFYKGAWVFFRAQAKENDTISLAMPDTFPLYREDGGYATQDLAQWFYEHAQAIAQAFDRRNGSDYFAKDLALA